MAENFSSEAQLADSYPLPEKTRVRFYLVTVDGVRTVDVQEEDLGYNRHTLSPLFHMGHELITALREHTPQ